MSGATKRKGVSLLPHAICGMQPTYLGSAITCPACYDVVQRKSLAQAIDAWNKQQREPSWTKLPPYL